MICILTSVSVFMKGIEGKGGDSGRASGVQCLPTAHLNPLSARQELDPQRPAPLRVETGPCGGGGSRAVGQPMGLLCQDAGIVTWLGWAPGGCVPGRAPGPPRRRCLPAASGPGADVSLWNILRNNIGKDLSKVSMPVQLNEPLNTLQRLCEELEYSGLLDQASRIADPCERMVPALTHPWAQPGYLFLLTVSASQKILAGLLPYC